MGQIRTARLIWMAMLAGLLIFTGVMWGVRQNMSLNPTQSTLTVLLLVWGTLAVTEAMSYLFLRHVLTQGMRQRWQENPADGDPEDSLAPHWFVLWLIGAAMIEALGLFAIIIFTISGSDVALGCAGGAIVMLALFAPGQRSLRQYTDAVTA